LPLTVQYDRLLRFFAETAKDISTPDLEILRHHFDAQGTEVGKQLAEVIEGRLALRKLC
jgi:hypothetical protein